MNPAHAVSPPCSSVDGAVPSAVTTATLSAKQTHPWSSSTPLLLPDVTHESNFSVLFLGVLLPVNTGYCCGVWWKSVEETTVKAHLSQQLFLGERSSVSISTTGARRVDVLVGSYCCDSASLLQGHRVD